MDSLLKWKVHTFGLLTVQFFWDICKVYNFSSKYFVPFNATSLFIGCIFWALTNYLLPNISSSYKVLGCRENLEVFSARTQHIEPLVHLLKVSLLLSLKLSLHCLNFISILIFWVLIRNSHQPLFTAPWVFSTTDMLIFPNTSHRPVPEASEGHSQVQQQAHFSRINFSLLDFFFIAATKYMILKM